MPNYLDDASESDKIVTRLYECMGHVDERITFDWTGANVLDLLDPNLCAFFNAKHLKKVSLVSKSLPACTTYYDVTPPEAKL